MRTTNQLSLMTFVLIWASVSVLGQQTIQVPGQYSTVQAAIAAAVNGDTILVSPGTYVENINFSGKDILLQGIAGPEQTILDGSGGTGAFGTVVTIASGEGNGAVLDGFTVQYGFGTIGFLGSDGGGINIINSSPVIRRCIVQYNYASAPPLPCCGFPWGTTQGAGIRLSMNDGMTVPRIEDCIIRNNVGHNGAGISAQTSIVIERCIVENNSGSIAFNGGGGILLGGGVSIIRDCIIRGNTISSVGGGLCLIGATTTVENCLVSGNVATHGGAIFGSLVHFLAAFQAIPWLGRACSRRMGATKVAGF